MVQLKPSNLKMGSCSEGAFLFLDVFMSTVAHLDPGTHRSRGHFLAQAEDAEVIWGEILC